MNKNDLIIHPVRSRVIGAVSGRALTTAEIARVLPDVPLPSLYRHVRVLAEAGLLAVAEERRVRGTTERAYTLVEGGGQIEPEALGTPEARVAALTNFTTIVGQAYTSYVRAGGTERPIANLVALYLSEAEAESIRDAIRRAVEAHLGNGPGEGRRRRQIAFVDLPDFEPETER